MTMKFLHWLTSWFKPAYDEPTPCPWGYTNCEWCNPDTGDDT